MKIRKPGQGRRVLIIVENLPCPFDRRVWQEATTLSAHGYCVSIICPKGKGYESSHEIVDGVHIFRHWLSAEADNALGYLFEYSTALFFQFFLSIRVALSRGFDVIHACNPPDNIFLIGSFWRVFGKRFVFDHHDITPELYEAKFQRRDFFYKVMLFWERMSFALADISIATNESYKEIAIIRGNMAPEDVYVVRSGPDLNRLHRQDPKPEYRQGRQYLVGYVGVMGAQEGLDHLMRVIALIVNEHGCRNIHFALVGGGTDLDKIKDYSKKLGISDFVTFTGRVSDEVLVDVLNTADVCVNPDVPTAMNDKSTMNKIMEYMALGKPIVQYDLTEGRRSALDASLYARPNDESDFAEKILFLIDNPELRRSMGEFGRDRVEKELEWNHEVPKLLAAYDAVFEKLGPAKSGR